MLDRVIARIKTIKEKYHHHFPYKSRNWSRQKPTFPHVHHFYNTVQHSSQWNSFLMKEGRVKPCCWEIYIVVQYSIVDQPQRKCSRSPCSFQIYWICWTCGGKKRQHSFAEKSRCIWKLYIVKRFQEVRFQIKRKTGNASTRSNMPTNKFNALSKIFMWRNAMFKSQFTPPPSPIFGHSNTTCRVTCNLQQTG